MVNRSDDHLISIHPCSQSSFHWLNSKLNKKIDEITFYISPIVTFFQTNLLDSLYRKVSIGRRARRAFNNLKVRGKMREIYLPDRYLANELYDIIRDDQTTCKRYIQRERNFSGDGGEKKKLRGNEEGGGGKVVSCDISMEEERLNLLVPWSCLSAYIVFFLLPYSAVYTARGRTSCRPAGCLSLVCRLDGAAQTDTFSFPAAKRPDSSAHQSNIIARRGQLR